MRERAVDSRSLTVTPIGCRRIEMRYRYTYEVSIVPGGCGKMGSYFLATSCTACASGWMSCLAITPFYSRRRSACVR
jgi:hypothetical protein